MILAELNLIDLFWTMLWVFFLFIWIMILVHVLMDLFRDSSLSGVAKALWVVALVLFTPLTVLIYLIVRGKGMGERDLAAQKQAQEQFASYVQQTAGAVSPADQIANAKALLDAGTITQAEFDQLKAKALQA